MANTVTDSGLRILVLSLRWTLRSWKKHNAAAMAMFAVLLTMHYRGKDSVDVAPGRITLEFVKHYHDAHPALDPDSLATKQQNDTDASAEETEREIRKHPEKKEQQEAKVAARQKDAADMIAFLKTGSLRATTAGQGIPKPAAGCCLARRANGSTTCRSRRNSCCGCPSETGSSSSRSRCRRVKGI